MCTCTQSQICETKTFHLQIHVINSHVIPNFSLDELTSLSLGQYSEDSVWYFPYTVLIFNSQSFEKHLVIFASVGKHQRIYSVGEESHMVLWRTEVLDEWLLLPVYILLFLLGGGGSGSDVRLNILLFQQESSEPRPLGTLYTQQCNRVLNCLK